MAYKDDWEEWWGWSYGGGESQRGAVGGEVGGAGYGLTNPGNPISSRAPLSSHLSRGELAAENRRLYLDNMRLWDCLALFRTDPSLTCQGAINTIFTLNDTEYLREFPDTHQLLNSRLPGGLAHHKNELDAVTENNRLREENTRLHAAVWVLRDNPALQADSTVAAVFRLSDAQFQRKFGVVNQVTAGLCFRNNLERSSRNNNKTKVKAMRTHLDLGVKTSTIHLIKKPLGPKRLSRAKSMSTNRQGDPPRENSVTAMCIARKRSESAEPPQNFSSNRKPTTAEEMQAFLCGQKYDWTGSFVGPEVSVSAERESKRARESTTKKTKKPETRKAALSSMSDTNQPGSASNLVDPTTRRSGRQAAKPIKCVSFEEPLPTSRDDDAPATPTGSDTDSDVDDISNDNEGKKHSSFKHRLRAILDAPMDSQACEVNGNRAERSCMKDEIVKMAEEKGQITNRKSRRRSASLTNSPTSTDKDHGEMTHRRGGSEIGGSHSRKSREQSWDFWDNPGGSNSNRMGSRCPADEETDEDENEEDGDDNSSRRGAVYSLSGRSRRPGGLRKSSILREPSKRHKQGILLSPVLDPRASLHRLHVSAGDAGLLDIEPRHKDRTGQAALDRNFNKSPNDVSEEEDEKEENEPGRIVFSDQANVNVPLIKFNHCGTINTVGAACFNEDDRVRRTAVVHPYTFEDQPGDEAEKTHEITNVDSGRCLLTCGNRNRNAASKRTLRGDNTVITDQKRSVEHLGVKNSLRQLHTQVKSKDQNSPKTGVLDLVSKHAKGEDRSVKNKTPLNSDSCQAKAKLKRSVIFKDGVIKYEDAVQKVDFERSNNASKTSKKAKPASGTVKDMIDNILKSNSKQSKANNSKTVANGGNTNILRCKSGKFDYRKSDKECNRDTSSSASLKGPILNNAEVKAKQNKTKVLKVDANGNKAIRGEEYHVAESGKMNENSQNNHIKMSKVNSVGIGRENLNFVRTIMDKVTANHVVNPEPDEVGNDTNTNRVSLPLEFFLASGVKGHGPHRKLQASRISTIERMDVPPVPPSITKDDEVFTDSKHRNFRRSLGSQSTQVPVDESDIAAMAGIPLQVDGGIVPPSHHYTRRSLRPKSAGVRQFSIIRQANLKRSAEALLKETESAAATTIASASEKEIHGLAQVSKPAVSKRSKPCVGAMDYELDPARKGSQKHAAATSHHDACACSPNAVVSSSYSNSPEELLAQPIVYLSQQPAPMRASRYKPYPHRTYVTVKQFTDRHQRLMPQAPPPMRRGTSAMFSFSRERSPSMALVLDDDFQRWMKERVRASSEHKLEATLGLDFNQPSAICRSDRKSANRRELEAWPRTRPPQHSIYEQDIPPGHAYAVPRKGSLKGCDNVSSCATKEIRLKMLKELGGVRYRAALAAMIRQNMQCAKKKISETKPTERTS